MLEGETQEVVSSPADVDRLIKKGQANRTVAATNMNRESSRSHAIFTAYIRMRTIDKENQETLRFSKLNVVDLAGSERVKDTNAEGQRLKEACKINQSLTFLGRVINFLAEAQSKSKRHNAYINYRESKLTHLLKDSLGGNSKTVIICTLNPNQMAIRETLSTLKFAERAKKIKNKARVNEQANESFFKKKYEELVKEIELMKNGKVSPKLGNLTSSDNMPEMMRQLKGVQGGLRDMLEDSAELRAHNQRFATEFEHYRQQTNFRLNLHQSREA